MRFKQKCQYGADSHLCFENENNIYETKCASLVQKETDILDWVTIKQFKYSADKTFQYDRNVDKTFSDKHSIKIESWIILTLNIYYQMKVVNFNYENK